MIILYYSILFLFMSYMVILSVLLTRMTCISPYLLIILLSMTYMIIFYAYMINSYSMSFLLNMTDIILRFILEF